MKSIELRFVTLIVGEVFFFGACNLTKPSAPDDKAITADIQAKFFQDPQLKTRDIHVDSQRSVVTLTGTVATDLERGAVERIASQEKGVRQVVNHLTISAPDTETMASAPPQPAAA